MKNDGISSIYNSNKILHKNWSRKGKTKEEREIETLSEFLPEQLSENEIKEIVFNSIKSLNAKTPQDIGKIMGSLKLDLQGKADMSLVSKLVKENLTK